MTDELASLTTIQTLLWVLLLLDSESFTTSLERSPGEGGGNLLRLLTLMFLMQLGKQQGIPNTKKTDYQVMTVRWNAKKAKRVRISSPLFSVAFAADSRCRTSSEWAERGKFWVRLAGYRQTQISSPSAVAALE